MFDRRRSDQGGFVGWLRRPPTNLSVAILFGSVCVLFGLIALSFSDLTSRVGDDEHATCVIQARGLPAGHELATSLVDIHQLLTLTPTTRAQRLAAAQTPPNVRRVVFDLNSHLAAYGRLESHQPTTRKC